MDWLSGTKVRVKEGSIIPQKVLYLQPKWTTLRMIISYTDQGKNVHQLILMNITEYDRERHNWSVIMEFIH